MNDPKLAQLLRELADTITRMDGLMCDRNVGLPIGVEPDQIAARALAAAEEIEARNAPTESDFIKEAIRVGLAFQPRDDSDEVYLPFDGADEPLDDLIIAYGRALLAHFGGGEVGE